MSDCVPGQVIEGAVVSVFETENTQFPEFPDASVAVSVTLNVPGPETVVPGIGLCETAGEASQLSDAEARPV